MEIRENAFFGCKELRSIVVLHGVWKIVEYAFHGCENLNSIELPESLEISLTNITFLTCPLWHGRVGKGIVFCGGKLSFCGGV